MSRCGRAIDLLAQWKAHPEGCTADHGWADGYDGPCTDDPWDIVNILDMIDPAFRTDEIARLRALVEQVDPTALAAYDVEHPRGELEVQREDPTCESSYDGGGRMEQVSCQLPPGHGGPHYHAAQDPGRYWRWEHPDTPSGA